MVPVLDILCRPRHPESPVTFPIRTHHGDRNFRKRTCCSPTPLYFLIVEQNQRKVYHEVLIAGDLSGEDVHRAAGQTLAFQRYGGNTFGTAEFLYGNDTVYFAQPSQSQFTPGGSGAGIFNQPVSVGRKDTTNNTFALTGRNAPKSNTGAVLRYAPPACRTQISPDVLVFTSFRYPQWGIRIHCEKLPDPEINL